VIHIKTTTGRGRAKNRPVVRRYYGGLGTRHPPRAWGTRTRRCPGPVLSRAALWGSSTLGPGCGLVFGGGKGKDAPRARTMWFGPARDKGVRWTRNKLDFSHRHRGECGCNLGQTEEATGL